MIRWSTQGRKLINSIGILECLIPGVAAGSWEKVKASHVSQRPQETSCSLCLGCQAEGTGGRAVAKYCNSDTRWSAKVVDCRRTTGPFARMAACLALLRFFLFRAGTLGGWSCCLVHELSPKPLHAALPNVPLPLHGFESMLRFVQILC